MSTGTAEPSHNFRILRFSTLASTNDEAMRRLRDGDPGGFAVVADSQTRGRGRQGRKWASPAGNLYASIALRDPSAAARAPQLGFVAGLAVIEALRMIVRERDLRLKWPNDVLLDGAKLAGLLLEASMLGDGRLVCVVGIGVNCASHPSDLPYPATDLRDAGCPEPWSLLALILRRFEHRLADWNRGEGFPLIRSLWLRCAAGIGAPIEVRLPCRSLSGIFRDIDGDGRLTLLGTEGVTMVDAGDVFFPAAMADTR